MAAITFPTISIRSNYDPAAGINYVGPWEDPKGKKWNWNGALERWQPYLPALYITESETEPSDRSTVWGVPSTGEFSWYSTVNEAWMAVAIISYADQIATLGDYPVTFPPTTHTHVSADITDLVAITHTPATTFAIPNPGAGTYAGQKVLYHIKPTAAINLTNANAHLLATDSLVTFPKALTANKTYIVQLMWNGSAWMLVTLVGGY